jgi:putative DNA primase/helicase
MLHHNFKSDPAPEDPPARVESEACRAALDFAAATGRPVFPADPRTKAPLVKDGFKAATTDPATIRRWWSIHRTALVAMPTGRGLVVVDIDIRNGGEVDPDWPATLIVRTRSGGWHLYYLSAEPVRCSAGKVAPGVDIRAAGGYAIVPSPGSGWSWGNDLPLAELPASIVAATGTVRAYERGELPANWTPFEPAVCVGEGGRNDYLARFAGWSLRNGVEPDELEEVLAIENAGACHPPLDREEVARIAASIARRHEARS